MPACGYKGNIEHRNAKPFSQKIYMKISFWKTFWTMLKFILLISRRLKNILENFLLKYQYKNHKNQPFSRIKKRGTLITQSPTIDLI